MEQQLPNLQNDFKTEKKKVGMSLNTDAIKGTLLNFVVPLICFGISLVLLITFIYPSYKSYPIKKAELENALILKKTLQTKINYLRKLVDFKEFVDQDSDLVNKVLVSEAQVPILLDQVHQMSTESGMSVQRLSYSYSGTSGKGTDEKKDHESVSVSLGVDCAYDQIILFMQTAEKAARFVQISNYRYSMGTNREGEQKLSANFSLDSPYLFVQSSAVTDDPISLDISNQEFLNFINMIKELKYFEFKNLEIEATEEEQPIPEDQVVEEEEVGLNEEEFIEE